MKAAFLVLASSIINSVAWADVSGITIEKVDYAGTGCVAGTLAFQNDSNTLSNFEFLDFKLSTRRGAARKTCNIAIAYQVPEGIQVGIAPIHRIMGSVSLPSQNSSLTVSREIFFAGQRGKVIRENFKGRQTKDIRLENEVLLRDLMWSACGQSVTVRAQITANLQNSSRGLATAVINQVELMKTGHLYWRRCQ
jgi:hypothetical protein